MIRCVILMLTMLVAPVAQALEPQQREVIVTHNRVWDGYKYIENFVPSDQDEIILMADADNAVSFVRTLEYYWPLARQKYVALETQRDEISGILRIFQNGAPIEDVAPDAFAIHYPEGVINGNAELFWGDAATEGHAEYKRAERAFNRAFAVARQELSRYERRLKEARADARNGETVDVGPAPAAPPEPSLRLVTTPLTAYRVALPAGRYTIAILDGDRVVPGTEKRLRVVEPLEQNLVVVAEVVPEERWTRPIAVNNSESRIYVRPGAEFYTTLHQANVYDESDYVGLTRPQAVGVDGRSIWVKRRQFDGDALTLSWAGAESETVARSELKVEQTRGSQFGYIVRPAHEREIADLNAFTIRVPNDMTSRGSLTLDSGVDPTFERQIVVVQPRQAGLVWGLAFVPVLLGFALVLRRRSTGVA